MKIYRSFSSAGTKRLGPELVRKIKNSKPLKKSLILALVGELGSGKTTFIQGFLRGLGIKKRITSPTFTIIKNYKSRVISYNSIYHIDCYRIHKAGELLSIGLKEIFNNQSNIVLIEWADKIKKILPKRTIWLEFKYGRKQNERIIKTQSVK